MKLPAPGRKKSLLRKALVIGTLLVGTLGTPVLAADTADIKKEVDEQFQAAMMSRESGDYAAAIEGFRSILSSQPKLPRPRLELAVAYYQTYKYEEAAAEARKVLDASDTPPRVKVAILAFLAQVEKGVKQTGGWGNFSFPVYLGFLYDSNAGRTSDEISLTDRSPGLAKNADSAKIASVGINHNYVIAQRAGGSRWTLLAQSGINFYHRGYFDETGENLNVLTLRTGPTFLAGDQWRANLNFQEEFIEYGKSKLANYHSITPTFVWQLSASTEVTVDGGWTGRDYEHDAIGEVDRGRDSDYLRAGGALTYTCINERLTLEAGAHYFSENADLAEYSNDGSDVYGEVKYQVWENTSLTARLGRTDYNYDARPALTVPSAVSPRDERDLHYSAGAAYTFTSGFLKDWIVEGRIVKTDYDSNVAVYDYKKTQTYVNLKRVF